MKVKCVNVELAKLEMSNFHRQYYERAYRDVLNGFQVGQIYVVYGVLIRADYPRYLVAQTDSRRAERDWTLAPGPYFEISDPRVSREWVFDTRLVKNRDYEALRTQLVIKELIEEPMFLERLIDGRPRELEIMAAAAARMDAEFD